MPHRVYCRPNKGAPYRLARSTTSESVPAQLSATSASQATQQQPAQAQLFDASALLADTRDNHNARAAALILLVLAMILASLLNREE